MLRVLLQCVAGPSLCGPYLCLGTTGAGCACFLCNVGVGIMVVLLQIAEQIVRERGRANPFFVE